jgi:hypothetical protein
MNPITLTLLVLAVAMMLVTWKHGSLFAGARAYWETRGGWVGELVGCPLCLSWHVAFWLVVLWNLLKLVPLIGSDLATMVLCVPAAAAAGLGLYQLLSRPYRHE